MAETKSDRIEREYVIPLRPEWRKVARYKKTNKAVKAVKEFLVRHMKIRDRDLNKVKVDKLLNEVLWSRGIRHPPTKIKVKAVKENGIVTAELYDMPEALKFKKARFDKRDEKARAVAESKKSTMEKLKETAAGAMKPKSDAEKAAESAGKSETVKEKEEKKAAVVEAEEKAEKEISKTEKHTAKVQNEKQAKGQRTGYNSTSRGK
jgi:large subunit ribosomal protein L31e